MRRLARLVALGAAAVASIVPATAARALPAGLPQPQADIVVDANSGRVLVCDNIHKAIHPASTAKIMTAIVAAERLAPDALVSVPANEADIPSEKVGFPAGAKWPLDQMMAALMMVSANDAAYAIAETTAGSLDNFATMLNDTARRLGMKDSTFNDPSGLDNWFSYKGGPFTSAYDLAIATRNAHATPEIAQWAAKATYDFTDPQGVTHHFTNHNKMLPGLGYAYPGADGFKTGYTDRAQHSLVATATRNGRTMIAVILGASDSGYPEAAALLDQGFASNGKAPDGSAVCGGAVLPPVGVSLYADRAADRDAFSHLGRDRAQADPAAIAAIVPPTVPNMTLTPPAPKPVAPATTGANASGGAHGLLSVRAAVVVLVALGIVVFLLRRRAIKRRRASRLAQRRQRMAAIRSGGLPVVDGRYRPGLRLGPPLESHVRVRRLDDHADSFDAELDALDV